MEKKGVIVFQCLKWVALCTLCFLAAYGIEKYVFQTEAALGTGLNETFHLKELEQRGFQYSDGSLKTNQEYAQLVLPAGGYIDKLKIEYDTETIVTLSYSSEVSADITEVDFDNMVQFDFRAKEMVKPIQAEQEQLVITLVGLKEPVTITGISFLSQYIFHWQRFIMVAAGLISILLILLKGKDIVKHPERVAAAICVLMGVALLGAVPYDKNSWDDETHFSNAYSMSYALLGQDTQWTKGIEEFMDIKIPYTDSYEERLNQEQYLDQAGVDKTTVEKNKGIGYYLNKIDGFPTAIGILIGRLSGLSFTDWFVAARLVNLLFYAIVIYFAIKITPIGKSLLTFLALLPTPLFLTVSYSTDFFMNSLMLLGAAVFLREYLTPDEKLKRKTVVLFVLVMFFACIRKAIYIPLILVGLLLPESKFQTRKQRNIYRAILAGSCVLVMLTVLFGAAGMTDVRGGDTSVSGQVSYILSNPISFAMMFVKQIVKESIGFIFDAEGKLNFNIYGMRGGLTQLIMVIFMVFLLICTKGEEKQSKISLKTSVISLGLIGLVICFIYGSMYLTYTEVGSSVIAGVQPRHYVPFLFLMFMMVPFYKVKCEISNAALMRMTLTMTVLLNVVCMYGILIKP